MITRYTPSQRLINQLVTDQKSIVGRNNSVLFREVIAWLPTVDTFYSVVSDLNDRVHWKVRNLC